MERKSQGKRTMLCFKFRCILIGFHMLESILTNRNPEILNNQKSYNDKSLKWKQTLRNIK